MSEFHFNEGAFEVPATGVTDRSITALEFATDGRPISVAVARQERGELTLDDIVTQSLAGLQVTLRRFKHTPPRDVDVHGARGVTFEMTWLHDAGPMFHEVVIVALDEAVLTLTAAGLESQSGAVKSIFKRTVGTLKLRRRR